MTPEQIAQQFHEVYERLAPNFGYQTREASAKPWADVPDRNKQLMIAVAAEVGNSIIMLIRRTADGAREEMRCTHRAAR